MNRDVMSVQEVSPVYEFVAENPAVPVGYKQTEVGVIPEDWEVAPLGDCLVTRPGYGINAAAAPYSDKLPTYIRITDISEEGRFKPSPAVSVRSELAKHYYLSANDIVFARTGASVGKSYLYRTDDGPLVYAGFLIRVTPDQLKLNSGFLAAYVTTGRYWQWVRLMSMRSGQPGINGVEYSQLPVPLPSLDEQHAIATALSDVDALLEELDRLIAKKRDIKQAAMQQLLTGESRLPGFEGEWDELQLGDVIDRFIGGGTPSRGNASYWNGTIPWVTVKDFVTFNPYQAQENITLEGLKNSASNLIPSGTLITSTRMALGKAVIYKVDVAINQDLKALALSSKISPDFLCYWFGYNANVIDQLGGGSTVKGISINQIKLIPIQLPSVDEQLAIVKVLDDMDTEIQALEQRRIKTAELKQGMMQELLTGRTRLV